MSEQPQNDLTKATGQVRNLWDKLDGRRRMLLVGSLGAMLLFLGYVTMGGRVERQAVLFSGLTQEDAGQLVQALQEQKVPYKVEAGGTAVTVPEERVHELRILLAAEGLPRGGSVGFEVFDDRTFGTTSFVEKLNFRRGLEGELARSISSLDVVERARVHVSMGERSIYRDEELKPSASVLLQLRPGASLGKEHGRAIVNLVAASVTGLDPSRVTVVSQDGRVLAGTGEDDGVQEQRLDLEQTLAARVERILERFVGPDQVAVTVTADIDTNQVERTEEVYEQGPENVALRSESRTVEGAGGTVIPQGVAGARGNLPGTAGPTTKQGQEDATRLSETKNYEVNRVVSKTVGPKASVKRLHVAVLVNGVANEKGEIVARDAAQLERLKALAREAAGLDEERGDRIEVASVPFVKTEAIAFEEPAPSGLENLVPGGKPVILAAAGGAGLLLVVVVAFMVMRGRSRRRATKMLPALPVKISQLAPDLGDRGYQGSVSPHALGGQSARDRALAAVRGDSELAARVISSWLDESARAKGDAA